MEGRLLDANIFLRHLMQDHSTHSPAARALFERIAAGEERCWTTPVVLAEVVWVLSGAVYSLGRAAIRDALSGLLAMPDIAIEDRGAVLSGLDLYADSSIDFIDAYHAALLLEQDSPELYSFDRDFDRIPGLRRLEPQAT